MCGKKDIPNITDAEYEIMKVIWDSDHTMDFSEIRKRIQTVHDWSQSTVKTLIQRLCKKEVLLQSKGSVYQYTPTICKDEYNDYIVNSMIDKFYNGDAKNLIANLVRETKLSNSELSDLREILDREDE